MDPNNIYILVKPEDEDIKQRIYNNTVIAMGLQPGLYDNGKIYPLRRVDYITKPSTTQNRKDPELFVVEATPNYPNRVNDKCK